MHGTREYLSWRAMLARCYYKKDPCYGRYGGRGIKVCKRWRDSFENFFADMGKRPLGLVLDRKNNDGDYTKMNCRWSTQKTNQRNRSSNHIIEFEGESMTLVEWAEKIGLNPRTLKTRITKLGWSIERALTEALRGS